MPPLTKENTFSKGKSITHSSDGIVAKISYLPIQQKSFKIQSTTTGKLKAQQHTTLHFKAAGTIEQLPIEEGQYIQKGTLVATVEQQALQLQLTQQQITLAEKEFEKKNLLIGSGGEAEVDTSVSPKLLESILLRSGVRSAQQQIKQTQFQIEQTKLYAPFGGVIADLEVEAYQQATMGQKICRLINPYTFEAVFQLTEAEALAVKIGQAVKVIPLANTNTSYPATIHIINPVVNEQGLVEVRAKLQKKGRKKLLDGMSVKVQIERQIPNQLVVPKEALVLRSGKSVIFTYDEKEGLAKWKYVTVAHENESELAISEGLTKDDLVIVKGNLNLSHDAQVEVELDE